MTSLDEIQNYAQRLGEQFLPEKVILFGSYAYGHPTPDSDVDLLVITTCAGDPLEKSVEMQLKLRPPFPLELHVHTPEKVQERLAMGDGFMREIINKGKIFYEASHA